MALHRRGAQAGGGNPATSASPRLLRTWLWVRQAAEEAARLAATSAGSAAQQSADARVRDQVEDLQRQLAATAELKQRLESAEQERDAARAENQQLRAEGARQVPTAGT
jgi:hypothetical protein